MHILFDNIIRRTRMEYWITKPTKIANKISSSCVVCIGMRAKNMKQKMAILDPVRTQPSPPFTHTAMDLAGPFLVADAVKKRVTKKVWVCVAVCRYTSAVNLEVVEDYSTNAFLQAFQIFTNRRGTPTTNLSDRGTQIVATSKATDNYFNMEKLMERVGEEKKISWNFAPVGSPHVNRQAERAIKAMKKCMTGVAQSKRVSYSEFAALISEVENIMNSRPYMEQDCMDPATGFPLSPEQVLGPRASYGRLEIDAGCNEATILERAANIKILAISFWKKFEQIILPGRLRFNK